jgi:hypothetical protein
MVRKVTAQRFEEWSAIPDNVNVFFRLLEGVGIEKPMRFRDACFAIPVPYTLMHAFVMRDAALKARYDAVLAAKADQLEHEALEIADKVEPDRDHVAKAKLQVDTRHALASKWDRDRYGDRLQIDKQVNVTVDAGLLGTAADLLRVVSTAGPRVIDAEDTLTLPAPKVQE